MKKRKNKKGSKMYTFIKFGITMSVVVILGAFVFTSETLGKIGSGFKNRAAATKTAKNPPIDIFQTYTKKECLSMRSHSIDPDGITIGLSNGQDFYIKNTHAKGDEEVIKEILEDRIEEKFCLEEGQVDITIKNRKIANIKLL